MKVAAGVVKVAVSNMVNAIRFISVEQGYDPRDFCLIATGGAGPLHANLIADELNIPKVVIPPNPGLASGLGLLISDIKHEVSKTVFTIKDLDDKKLIEIFNNLTIDIKTKLYDQGVKNEDIKIIFSVDARYVGQSYELNCQVDNVALTDLNVNIFKEIFHNEHKRASIFLIFLNSFKNNLIIFSKAFFEINAEGVAAVYNIGKISSSLFFASEIKPPIEVFVPS